jgi:hypothetical protein
MQIGGRRSFVSLFVVLGIAIFLLLLIRVATRLVHEEISYDRSAQASTSPHANNSPSPALAGPPRLYPPIRPFGALNPAVTQETIEQTICSYGYTKKIRPSYAYTRRLKKAMLIQARAPGAPSDYELDHFVPLELGGCVDCPDNLWLEPYWPLPGALQKDRVENYLRRQVCAHKMNLDDAQRLIIDDWYAVYLSILGKSATVTEGGEADEGENAGEPNAPETRQ